MRIRTLIGTASLIVSVLAARGGSLSDNFNTAHNYLVGGGTGTIWDGVYTGAGSFSGGNVGNAAGSVPVADANVTGSARLTVQSIQTGWEKKEDDGFFLFKTVSGDFSVTVHVISPFDSSPYNTAGLMARAAGVGGSPYNGKENFVSWTRFDQFGYANYLRNTVNNTTAQVNPGNAPNSNYWLRMDRVNDVNFVFYEKARESDPWQVVSFPSPVNGTNLVRSDLSGVPLQVGLSHAVFNSGIIATAQFEKFTLTGPNLGTGPVTFVTQPQGQIVTQGRPVNFIANMTGTSPVSLQWYRSGAAMAGQTNLTLAFAANLGDDGASYQLLATNVVSGVTNTAATTPAMLLVVPDPVQPVLMGATGTTSTVTVAFSEPISAATATNPANFSMFALTGPGGTVTVNSATPDATGTVITLSTSPLLVTRDYYVAVTGLTDLAGNLIEPGNQAVFEVPGPPVTNVLIDYFSFAHDYLANGLAETMWDGVYTGAGAFPGGNPGPTAGATLIANANLTGTNQLTVESMQTDWEAYDDGFFLFKTVTGDFSMSVHVVSPFDHSNFNTAGLMVRAAGAGGAPYNGIEDFISWTRFDEGAYANYLRMTVGGVLQQITPGNAPNSNYWLRIDRVNGGQFYFYEKAQDTDPWHLVNFGTNVIAASPMVRSDLANLPLQVGIIHATFAATPLQVQFEKFSLSGTNVGTGGVAFAGQPQNTTVPVGQPATFTADVRGVPPFTYQWLRNGQAIPNQTNLTLTFNTVGADNQAAYQLSAINGIGNTFVALSSNAILTLTGDLNPPALVNARSFGTNGANLLFSEPVLASTATNTANYTLTGPAGGVAITGATLDVSGAVVTLATPPLVPGANYTVTVSNVTDTTGNPVAPGTQATFVATPYLVADVGAPSPSGGFVPSTNGFALQAAGAGVGGVGDQFTFAYQTFTGDFDVQVRLGSLGLSDLWSEAGLMARDGLTSNSLFAAAFATPGPSGCFFMSRTSPGSLASQSGSFPVNYPNTWVRLKRAGNVFSGYASLDGASWTQLGTVTLAASSTLNVGVAVTSHNATQTTTASFGTLSTTASTVANNTALPFEPLGPSSRHTGLVLSEIMYHPNGVSSGSLEFVELYNSDLAYEDISGYQLSGSINYTFPPGTILPSGACLVVASDPASLQSYYGITGVMGPYTNKLPNSSGTVQLLNDLNSVLLAVDYDTVSPWPIAPDGAGHSLVLRRPSYGENDPHAWGISDVIGGSPGSGDSYGAEPLRGLVINEFLAHPVVPDIDTIELFNSGNAPMDISGCTLSDDPDTNKFVAPTNTIVAARGFVTFDKTQLGFGLSKAGGTIYLKNPSLNRVLDAVRFEPQQAGISFGRYPNGADDWYRLSTKTFGAGNTAPLFSDVGINEIMYRPISGLDDDQYVELYNHGSNSINLGGWSFASGISFTIPSNTVLPANGYLVVAANMARMLANYTNLNATNTVGNFNGKLSHNGERLALAMPETQVTTNGQGVVSTNVVAVVVDEVTYGIGGRWGQWSDAGGSSLELVDPRSNKRLAPNWADSDETMKAPWTTIERTDVIDMGMGTTGQGVPTRFEVISQDAGEFLLDDAEVLNNAGPNLVTNPGVEGAGGWSWQGTFSKTSVETVLPAYDGSRSLHVRASGGGDTGANRVYNNLPALTVGGTNQATLRSHARWLKGDTNLLMRIRGSWLECAGGMTVPSNLGTPGAPNSRLVTNAGPAITGVTHYPILPAALQNVVVSAHVSDPDGVTNVTLNYRVDGFGGSGSAIMRDDGTGGDAQAGDGIYSATIPGQATGRVVAFYVQATDGHAPSASTVFPTGSLRECLVNFGEPFPTVNIGTYHLWLTQSNLSYWTNRAKNSNEGLDATFAYGNWRVIYNAQTEYSGSPWHTPSYNGPMGNFPCNYLMDFNADDDFLGSTGFLLESQGPADGVTFNNDASAQAENTAHWMAHKLGIRPDNRRHVLVYMNGQQRGLIYYDYQKPNHEVLKEFYPNDSDGHLHKIDDWFEFDDVGSAQNIITAKLLEYNLNGKKRTERYRWSWEPVGGSPPNDFTDLYALVDAVNAPGPEPYNSATLNLVNMREWMRMFALEHMAGDWDSYGYRRGKNMYAYKPTAGPWELLLYDIQLDFGKTSDGTGQALFDQGNTGDVTLGDPMIARMYTNGPFVREFWEAMSEMANNLMLPAVYGPLMDARVAALRANGVNVEDPTSIKNWIAARRAFILPQIPQAAFTINGPTAFNTSSNDIVVTGSAPIGVEKIVVNGVSYPLTWTGVTTWSLKVPLTSGANALAFNAQDQSGNTVTNGTASLAVNYTGGNVSPVGSIVFNEIMHHPAVNGGQFVELYNSQTNYTFDLSNWRVDGLGYTFPPGATLGPTNFLVLAQDRYIFPAAYGITTNTPFDEFSATLDPTAETLSLVQPGVTNAPDLVVARIRYETNAPWPPAAIQPGSSLQLIDPLQDDWRAGNWSATITNPPPPAPQWVQVTATGTASSSVLYVYLESSGDVYLDDIQLVAGSVAGVGANTIANGNYESGFPGSVWNVSTNLTGSVLSTAVKHSGNASLHVISTSAGTTQSNAMWQTITPALSNGATYTLSFWYLQSTNGGPLTIRLSGSGILSTVNPAPPAAAALTTATPGASNSVAAPLPAFAPLWINELQADNITGITNSAGQRTPWIELYNPTSNAVSLNGLYLASNYTNLTAWAFPSNAAIAAGQFEVIFADGQTNLSTTNELHTSFTLASGTGSVALSRVYNGQPQVLDYVNYANVGANHSYGSFPDGQSFSRQEFFFVTPGGTNNGTATPLTVVINEWLADNGTTIRNPVGNKFDDWFELYNYGDSTANLGGYFLTDNLNNRFQVQIPSGWSIPPHGYLLVWADNKSPTNSTSGDLHVTFALSKGGESIGLFAPDGSPIDFVNFGPQTTDVTEGRYPDGGPLIYPMHTVTPRAANVYNNTAPSLPVINNRVITLGQAVSFNAGATDVDSPPQSLSYVLGVGAPVGAGIDPVSGAFLWSPGIAPATNSLTVTVWDNGTPALNASRTFTVTVLPPPPVNGAALTGNQFSMNWTSVLGTRYQVVYKNDLTDPVWLPIGSPITGSGGTVGFTNSIITTTNRFFRLQILP